MLGAIQLYNSTTEGVGDGSEETEHTRRHPGRGRGHAPIALDAARSKPAVPLGGKYRLVDIPISNCINSDILKIFVLTQYNSASLNKHIATTYRFSQFSNGFVEILAAEQTPQNPQWFQGTADAVRQVLPHISDWGIDTLLILSGDHLYRMDYRKFIARHFETEADVTISVVPFVREQAEDFGLMKMEPTGRITEFREKPKGEALEEMRVDTTPFGLSAEEAARRPFLASMGIYVFKFDWLVKLLARDPTWMDLASRSSRPPSRAATCRAISSTTTGRTSGRSRPSTRRTST